MSSERSEAEKPRSRLMMALALGLAALLLFLALRGMDWAEFLRVMNGGHYELLAVLVLIASGNYLIRSLRWRILINVERPTPVLTVFWATMLGYLGNAYLPARAGELLRSFALGKKNGAGTSFILATALVERIMDVLALIFVSAVALLFLPDLPSLFTTAIFAMGLLALLGLVIVFGLPRLEQRVQQVIHFVIRRADWAEKILGLVKRFTEGMRVLQNPQRAAGFLLLTAIIWLIDGGSVVVGVTMIFQKLNLAQALLFLSGLGLSSALPSTPGYVGVYQFVAVGVLMPFGFSQGEALAYILIVQAVNYITVTLWGLMGLWRLR